MWSYTFCLRPRGVGPLSRICLALAAFLLWSSGAWAQNSRVVVVPADVWLAMSIQAAFFQSPMLRGQPLHVQVVNGVAQVSGVVETPQARIEALAIATKIAGREAEDNVTVSSVLGPGAAIVVGTLPPGTVVSGSAVAAGVLSGIGEAPGLEVEGGVGMPGTMTLAGVAAAPATAGGPLTTGGASGVRAPARAGVTAGTSGTPAPPGALTAGDIAALIGNSPPMSVGNFPEQQAAESTAQQIGALEPPRAGYRAPAAAGRQPMGAAPTGVGRQATGARTPGTGSRGTTGIGASERGTGKQGTTGIGASERGAGKEGTTGIGASERGTGEQGTTGIGASERGTGKRGTVGTGPRRRQSGRPHGAGTPVGMKGSTSAAATRTTGTARQVEYSSSAREDALLSSKLRRRFASDPTLRNVAVEVDDRVILLTGEGISAVDRERAFQLAKSLRGSRGIVARFR